MQMFGGIPYAHNWDVVKTCHFVLFIIVSVRPIGRVGDALHAILLLVHVITCNYAILDY